MSTAEEIMSLAEWQNALHTGAENSRRIDRVPVNYGRDMDPNVKLQRLHYKWVSFTGTPNLDKIQSLILEELRYRNDHPDTCTAGLMSEMRGELILCGKLRRIFGLARAKRQREARSRA